MYNLALQHRWIDVQETLLAGTGLKMPPSMRVGA